MENLEVYAKPDCVDFMRTKAQLDELGVEFNFHNIIENAELAEQSQRIASSPRSPVVIFPDGVFLVEPSNAEMEAMLRQQRLIG